MKTPLVYSNDTMIVIIEASKLFDGATVTKRTCDKLYTLKKDLKVYPLERKEGDDPISIQGCFLCDNEGSFNQIKPDTLVAWRVQAEMLFWCLQNRFEERDGR
jgi:hypothetical protein